MRPNSSQPGSPPTSAALSDNRILGAPLRRGMVTLVLPVLAEQFLNTLVGLVDTYLAGNLPSGTVEATSAVGLAAYVGWLVSMLFALVGTGTTALVARACGAGDRDLANRVANQSLLLSVVMGLCGVVAMYSLAPAFTRWQNMQGSTYAITLFYLRVDALGYVATAITLVGSAALRGAGDMRTPMKVLLLVNVLNVFMSCALVHGWGPAPQMGVNGIVGGTLCARLIGGLLISAVLISGWTPLRLQVRLFRPAGALIWRILRIGLPAAADGAVMWTGHFLFMSLIGRMVSADDPQVNYAYAAHIVVVRIEAFTYLPASAWAAACATMIGQALGAGLPERARRSGHEGALQCGLLTAVIGVLFVVFARPLCGLMHTDPRVLEEAVPVLRLAGVFQPALAIAIVYLGSLRGAGDTIYPLVYTALGLALVRLPFGYLLGLHLGWGLLGAWIAICGDMVARVTLAAVRYRRGRWVTIRV